MSEYKLLKDFGELVPGMIFKSQSGSKLNVVGVNDNCVEFNFDYEDINLTWTINMFTSFYKLIHDPRPVQKTIQEKISEHKLQIEILEKELEKESLKNVFKKNLFYRIENKSKEIVLISATLICDDRVWGVHVDGCTRKIMYSDISIVWLIPDIEHCFWRDVRSIVFQKKV